MPGLIEGTSQLSARQGNGVSRAKYDHVDGRQLIGNDSKTLSSRSLEAVPVNRARSTALGDCEPESSVFGLSESRKDRESSDAETPRPCEDAFKGSGVSQPPGSGEMRSGSEPRSTCLFQVQWVRRTRPLARRALRTLRPLRVALRARKPWLRARFRRLGWNVRFMLG